MLEGGRISNRQLIFLMLFTVLGTANMFLPALAAEHAKQDAWLSPFFSMLEGLWVVFIITELGRRFPGKTLIEYLRLITGPVLGTGLGCLFIFWMIHTNAIIIREFAELIVTTMMPETPIIIFLATITFTAALLVRAGLEVMGRTAEFLSPIFLGTFVLIPLLVGEIMKPENLLPILEKGIKPVIAGGLAPGGWFGEVALLGMLLPYLREPHKGRQAVALAVGVITVNLSVTGFAVTAVFGPEPNLMFPFLTLAQNIRVAEFLERIESLILVVWVAGVAVKIAVFYYAAVLATAQLTGVKDYRCVVTPIGVILTVLAIIIYDNIMELVNFVARIWPFYGPTFEWVIPALLLVVAIVTRKKSPPPPEDPDPERNVGTH
ncbi:MAG: endospore germination permease [Clostridia bacterium]|nr:endospore germination permease [Clostridia bacterium]